MHLPGVLLVCPLKGNRSQANFAVSISADPRGIHASLQEYHVRAVEQVIMEGSWGQ